MTPRRMRWSNRLAAVLFALARWMQYVERQLTRAAWACSYCEWCGENRYYGRTCREVRGS